MIIGCFANNAAEAMQLMPMAFIPFLLFTNCLVSYWKRWIHWSDPFKYLVDALSITEFDGVLRDWECVIHETTGQEVCDYLYNGNVYLKQIDAGYLNTKWLQDFLWTSTTSTTTTIIT